MTNQPTVVVGGAVTGNVGSCEIKSTQTYVSSFYTRTMAINSCTGEVVNDNTYYDWSYIYFPSVVIVIIFVVALVIRKLNNY